MAKPGGRLSLGWVAGAGGVCGGGCEEDAAVSAACELHAARRSKAAGARARQGVRLRFGSGIGKRLELLIRLRRHKVAEYS